MKKLMLGNEAVARGAYEAGVKLASAYPGTPSTEITEFIAKYDEIYSEWSPNEKVALEVAIGASLAGGRALVSMKHVGLNVAADPLFTCAYTGINAGLVIVVADDPGMSSSQNEQDSRYYALASKVPMLEPSNSQECKDFIILAFEISEKFDTPVILRLTARIAHSSSIVEIGEKQKVDLKEYKKDPAKYVMVPAMARGRRIEVEKRMNALNEYTETSALNSIEWSSKSIGVITSGICYNYTKEAFKDASILKLGILNPLPIKLIEKFINSIEKAYVIEELDPFIENIIKQNGYKVTGKELMPNIGELSTSIIKQRILNENSSAEYKVKEVIPARPPVMCPGCPHRGVFHVLRKLKLNVSGDIGCYSLGALPPLEAMDLCICMGASIGAALGMEKVRGREFAKKTVAVLGDSTFIHSGITGLIDIVYNKGTGTVIILDNSTTAMTGHQPNPATGNTIKNTPAVQLDFVKLCNAVGVERVKVIDPFDLKLVEKTIKEELEAEEPSVIIMKRPCALLKEVKYKGVMSIDKDKCKNCASCLGIGCPAISKVGNGFEINPAVCNGCGLCTEVCRFDAIVRVDERRGKK